MKFLFSYQYTGTQNGSSVSGFGSITVITTGCKITSEMIYHGENSAIGLATASLSDFQNVSIVPLGWFKFDE